MQRSSSPVFHFFFSHQFFTGLFLGYLLAALILHFQLRGPCAIRVYPAAEHLLVKQNCTESSTALPPVTATISLNTSVTSASVKQERILCWVVTTPSNKLKAEAVNNTWGRRCDKLLFMSSQNDSSLPVVALPIGEESRKKLWDKAKLTFQYIYNNHLNDYDWFFKADDDTYAVMENMRRLLSSFNSSQPLFLGHEFGAGEGRFLSGGAGYILTRESLRRLVEKGLGENMCPTKYKGEEDDVTITQCLEKVGAIAPQTTDPSGHHRFLSCDIEQFYADKRNVENCKNGGKGMNCLSDDPITFHYVPGIRMMTYDYLIYQMKINQSQQSNP